MAKRILGLLLALTALLSVPAAAAERDTGFADVAPDAWYADGVVYVREKDIMNGTWDGKSAPVFSPEEQMSRAMLAVVLHRMAGCPAAPGISGFPDADNNAYYIEAVLWASHMEFIKGYSDGRFGVDDPVTREQLATILWRYDGSPAAGQSQDFADEGEVAPYAAQAVDWARAGGIIGGKSGNRFDPKGNATRGEVASILYHYLSGKDPQAGAGREETRTLVVYFSATGNTEKAAKAAAGALGADLHKIVPQTLYTAGDLDWGDPSSRAAQEQNDPDSRPAVSGAAMDLTGYDTVLLGYPIWWGEAPHILRTFLEANDLAGKTVIPFCTSNTSGMGSSAENLHDCAPDALWQEGHRLPGDATEAMVLDWVRSLGL